MRLSSVIIFGVMITLGCGVYNVANRYEKAEKKLDVVQRKIGGEEEAMRVLQAEWTFLTSPDRLEKISQEYLHLAAVDGRQYVALNTIPMRAAMDAQQDIIEPSQQVASLEQAAKKEAVKTQTTKEKVVASVEAAETEFEKIIAKELAPVSQLLPTASTTPLPELQATPVSLTEGVE